MNPVTFHITKIIFLFMSVMPYACSKSDPAISSHQEIVEPSDFRGIRVIQDELDSHRILLAGSHDLNFIVSFENMLFNEEYLVISAIQDSLPVIFKDQFGNDWNIWGQAVKGPLSGTVLKPTTSVMGFFFAMAAFYPEATIYGDSKIPERKFTTNDAEWLVDVNQVYTGTLSFDAIPAIDTPRHIHFRNRDFLDGFFVDDHDLVVGIWIDSVPRVYPHAILNWHEIVNDSTPDHFYSITYCPLTATAMSWERRIGAEVTSFGVSGFLYNSNLMPYDRLTKSIWSQLRRDCVNGPLIAREAQNIPVLETSWGTWKQLFPESYVLSTQTGYDRDYTDYPYGDYPNDPDLIAFPLTHYDSRIPAKERVHAYYTTDGPGFTGLIISDKRRTKFFLFYLSSLAAMDTRNVMVNDLHTIYLNYSLPKIS